MYIEPVGIREVHGIVNGKVAEFSDYASAAYWLDFQNGVSYPVLAAESAGSNAHLALAPKGNGWLRHVAETGQTPTYYADGADANHNLILKTKGTGIIFAQNTPSGTTYVVTRVAAPSTASSTGVVGQIAADASYIYMCIGTNSWVRTSAASW
jgi:hypothetical protein